jgi:hypothetical protein
MKLITIMNYFVVVLLALGLPLTAWCDPEFHFDISIPADLKGAVEKYYEAEQRHEWRTTYAMRSKEFGSTVPFSLYSEKMESGMRDVDLTAVRIVKSSVSHAHYILTTQFVELSRRARATLKQNGTSDSDRGGKITERTIWVFREDNWVCVECGTRMRLTLNGPVVVPDDDNY